MAIAPIPPYFVYDEFHQDLDAASYTTPSVLVGGALVGLL